MDPNHDGFVSKTIAGFSNDGYNVDEFEITMFGLPQLGGDVTGDNTGNSCGITDLIPDNRGHSSYAVRTAANNLIFRFRVGDDNPSVESWTILLDTDGLFGDDDPNATPENPGFEIDITLIKRNNAGVYVYNIDGIDSCPNELLFYSISSNFQISIADEISCGDPDYFYDFFVPFTPVASALGININTGVRYVAVTNVSATCAMAGKIADVSGVNNNDPEYANCISCAFEDLVSNQCPTSFVDLCETCNGFTQDLVNAPTIDEPLRAGQTRISGTSDDGIYIVVKAFPRIGGTDAAPIWSSTARETMAAYATGTLWAINLTIPLVAYDKIVARAQADEFSVPCGGDDDESSSTSITVVAPNTKPVANNQTVPATEDTPKAIALTGTDAENDPLIYSILSQPAHGTLSGTAPNITYTPNLNYNGGDSFTFRVNDGIYNSDLPGTVTINVQAVNDLPIANNQSVTTSEDVAKAVTLTASDVDANALTYIVITPPAHGSLTGTGANLTYTPSLNYNGSDSFTFRANDGTANSNTATVSITITPVNNDAPIANNQSVTVQEDVPKPIVLTGTDPDGEAITFSIVTPPAHGTLSGSGANVTYTPTLNYSGADSFTFRATDGTLISATATVSITITAQNDAPIASNQNVVYDINTPKNITLIGSDPDGDPLIFIILTLPTNGILTGTGANVTYTPGVGFTGNDSFTFRVNDGTLNSNIATVSLALDVLGNNAPVANDQTVNMIEDVPTGTVLDATDVDGDALTYTITIPPTHGTVNLVGANVTYTPTLNYNGSDGFSFRANDGIENSNMATVTINISAAGDPPVADSQSLTLAEDTPTPVNLTGNDPDGDAITFLIISTPAHGTLTGAGANRIYTPNQNYYGSDSFTFNVNDGTSNSNTATVSLTITALNDDAPIANDQSVTTEEDIAKAITLTGNDPDGSPVTFQITQPLHGSLSGVIGADVTYTPAANYFGADSFTFTVFDGSATSNIAIVTITVTPVGEPPVAFNKLVTIDEDEIKAITLQANDPDGDAITFTILSSPQHGALSGLGADQTYTPNQNYNGADSFTFSVFDGQNNSNTATVSITINPKNDLDIVEIPTLYVLEDSSRLVCLNVIDVENDHVTYTPPVQVLGGGTMTQSPDFDFCFTFKQDAINYNGRSSWTMSACDDGAPSVCKDRLVEIIITPVNDTPDALNDFREAQSGTLITYNDVMNNDLFIVAPYQEFYDIFEADSTDTLVLDHLATFNGTATINGQGEIEYRPNRQFEGTDSIRYWVRDSGGLLDSAVVTIEVGPPPFHIYNAVSPDDNGLNDYWRIDGIEQYPKNLVRIFDRFNNLVYETNGYVNKSAGETKNNYWHGQSNHGLAKSALPEGTYFYSILLGDGSDPIGGYILLKRN
jgi:gliding motility-associated-like protein